MIEIVFAIIMGFGLAMISGAALADETRLERIVLQAVALIVVLLAIIAMRSGEAVGIVQLTQGLIISSFEHRLGWVLLGATMALLIQLYQEGHLETLWIKLSPGTAPTQEARAGQRSHTQGFGARKTVPATLVGTSTQYLTHELDLRTETLIRLAFYAFEQRGARIVTHLEAAMHLGTGQRQRSYLRIVAGIKGRPNPKRTVHRYWRSVNGSSRMGQALFGELCHLANVTQNLDQATVNRLRKVGEALKLTPDEMSRSLSFMR